MNMWEHGDEQKGLSELVRYEAREFKTNDRPHTKVEWEGVRGNSLIANLQFGHSRQDGTSPFLNTPQIVGRSDLDTEIVSGDNVVSGETSWAGFYHTTGSLTWYKANWGGGNHEFKTGFDYGNGATEVWGLTPKDFNSPPASAAPPVLPPPGLLAPPPYAPLSCPDPTPFCLDGGRGRS